LFAFAVGGEDGKEKRKDIGKLRTSPVWHLFVLAGDDEGRGGEGRGGGREREGVAAGEMMAANKHLREGGGGGATMSFLVRALWSEGSWASFKS
jgi:hypothetical protein